jgi:hypothetical protein
VNKLNAESEKKQVYFRKSSIEDPRRKVPIFRLKIAMEINLDKKEVEFDFSSEQGRQDFLQAFVANLTEAGYEVIENLSEKVEEAGNC